MVYPRLLQALFAFCIAFLLALPASQAVDSGDISPEQLSAAESKLLKKTYGNDPLPKRLQRLELLAFGATQYGSNLERWHNIKLYLSDAGSGNVSSSLKELEKYVFKRTYPALTTNTRLNKLEAKLFGQPTPSMPAQQRIERLQRTLGLADTPGVMAQAPNRSWPPNMRGFNSMPGMSPMPPSLFGDNFGFNQFGFNQDDLAFPELNQFDSQMSQMLRQMEEQMQQLPGNGQYQFRYRIEGTPNSNHGSKRSHKGNSTPNPAPNFNAPQVTPPIQGRPGENIPSYNDPNFI